MSALFGKLAFVHGALWRKDGFYRACLFLGPAPLLGGVLAAALWFGGLGRLIDQPQPPPRWAVTEKVDHWDQTNEKPATVAPHSPLPSIAADGSLEGYAPGWRMTDNRLDINPGYDANLDQTPLTAFSIDTPSIDMERVIAERPKLPLYAASGGALLVARTAGIYMLSARLDRPAAQPASCMSRLGFGGHRIISSVEVSLVNDVSRVFPAARFELQPGLYSIGWAFGCWKDQDMVGPGRLTLMIAHPGEDTLQPAQAGDIVEPRTSR